MTEKNREWETEKKRLNAFLFSTVITFLSSTVKWPEEPFITSLKGTCHAFCDFFLFYAVMSDDYVKHGQSSKM